MTDNNAHRGAEAQLTLKNSPAYRVAYSMYVALGGDPMTEFSSVEEIYDAIDVLFGKGNNRITVEAIAMEIVENGDYNFNDEEVTGYKPVNIKVEVPQKYTDEQVENIRVEAETTGYNTGYGVGMNDGYNNGYGVGYAEGDAAGQQTGYTTGYGEGFTAGETEGYNDGYAEGLDDGAEDQKALLEDITITANGVYEKEDGYKKVTVEMAAAPSGEGFDFSMLGYNTEFSNIINNTTLEQINYSKNILDTWVSNTIPNNINFVYVPSLDVSNVMFGSLFNGCENIQYVPYLNFSSTLTSTASLFNKCTSLRYIEGIGDTSNVTNMSHMFGSCINLTSIPQFDTSNVTNMQNMFTTCTGLTSIPQMDTSKVTNMERMFYQCTKLTTIPQFDTSNVTNMYYMCYECNKLTSLPALDCSKVTSIGNFFGYSSMPQFTDIGGFINLGMASSLSGTTSAFLGYLTGLTHESLMNIINNLYDRASAGYSVLTLKFSSKSLALLSDEDIAIATNKGWTLS